MEYIRIMNEASNPVPRIYLEKLGISTKRDEDQTIGQFGSGVKFAPIAALRNDWEWIFAGADDTSPYILEYVKKEGDDGFNHVMYHYTNLFSDSSEVIEKESSFTVDAGVLSWDTSFQIFREAIANAVDENIRNDAKFSIEVVSIDTVEDFYVDGHFCVYLTADPELVRFVTDFDRYFLFHRTPYYVAPAGKSEIYDPHDEEMRIYHKGILVNFDSNNGQTAIFDYEFSSLTLNEERRVRDYYEITSSIASFINDIEDIDVMRAFFVAFDDPSYIEYHLSSYAAYGNNCVVEAFRRQFGENAVYVEPGASKSLLTEIRARGYKPITVSSKYWLKVLERSGVPSGADVTGMPMDLEVVTPTLLQRKMLDNAIHQVAKVDSRIYDFPSILIFKPSENQALMGVTRGSQIFISTGILTSVENVIGTIIHEMDHYLTKNPNHDAEFRDAADRRIGQLVMLVNQLSW